MIHELKTWPQYFQDIKEGKKTFEIRKNDRNYQVGDVLLLKEWDPNTLEGEYTGEEMKVHVTYIMKSMPEYISYFGIGSGVVVMSILLMKYYE
jgi:ASC-1-like (ASCH) protein